jgi:hypothetical protein
MIKNLKVVNLQVKTIHFAHFQTYLKFGIMLWGLDHDSVKVFYIQNKVIKIMAGVRNPVDRFSWITKY